PPAIQVEPSADTHRVTALPRLMASLRAKLALAMKSLADERSWLLRLAFLYDGMAIIVRITSNVMVIIISMSVNPRFPGIRADMAVAFIDAECTSTPALWAGSTYCRAVSWVPNPRA